ncbi:MAG TPA: adenylyl-sulfate kinase [Nitrospirota bacterium]|nr:adenylyl-sulfate kinase [Nitrospirota bacterium]
MNIEQGFGIWITGLPSSGKSSVTGELVKKLMAGGAHVVVLESDEMRKILTPEPTYSPEERDRFYRTLALLGELLTRQGISVIFDATANKRAYRDHARTLLRKFIEVYVECPIEVCRKRDPKGIYAKAASGLATAVPGIQAAYEPPLRPELTIDGQASPADGAGAVVSKLKKLQYIKES